MADKSMSDRDFSLVAQFIKAEKDRRAGRRKDNVRLWQEVDRLVAM